MYDSKKEKLKMKLLIDDDRKLYALQADFNSFFPYLKLEFFKIPHKIGEGSSKKLLYDNSRSIRDCRVRHVNGEINLTDQMKVSELEDLLLNDYGLSAQVFRKSGNVWLETSATDNWTLKQQNDEGAELSIQIRNQREEWDAE